MMRSSTLHSSFIFRQLFDKISSTYTYLLGDEKSKEALLIDPVVETAQRDEKLIRQLGLNLIYCCNTHVHADHITGSGFLKHWFPNCKSVISEVSGAKADIYVNDGSSLTFGSYELEIRSTPGHTNGCITYVSHAKGLAFTGDALLIRGCGRTDFQEGNSTTLYHSVWNQILSLPDDYLLYPAHDYNGLCVTSVKEEKKYNPRLTKSVENFVQIMNELQLPYPKLIDKALPANLQCGLQDLPEDVQNLMETLIRKK